MRRAMKLNLFILQDELRDIESSVLCDTGMELVFDRFESYSGQELLPDCLYLIDASKITPDLVLRENLFLLCFGTLENHVLQYRRCNILMLPHERRSERCIHLVGRVFAKYHRWSESLLMMAMANDAIRQIFTSDILDEVFGNPILMQSGNGLFGITSGTLPEDFDSRRWKNIVEQGSETLGEEGIGYDELVLQESIREPFVFEKTERYTLIGINAFLGGELQGRLIHCNAVRDFTKGYLSLAIYFNDIFAGIVERNIEDEIVGCDDCNVFIELLGGWHTGTAWLDNQLARIKWEKNVPRRLIVVASNASRAPLIGMVGDNLRAVIPDGYVFPYKGDYLAIFKADDVGDEFWTSLERIADHLDAAVAVSLPFSDISRLRSVYKQCRYLLEDGMVREDGRIRFYDNAIFRHLAVSYGIDRDYKWLLHPQVCLLDLYDKSHGGKLVKCLQTIIECGFRRKDAAEKLCVHHNTITYRIERIRSIAGIDLDAIGQSSDDELFHVLLSCKLLTEFSDSK